jgi:DnaJ-domain-containing protein 1
MHLKDYYKTLELEPSATVTEIKKAYRRLALLYHPDKTQNDPYAAAQFAEIKEAYEVLHNPSRKSHYLQQRWYQQSTGKKRTQEVVNPVTILKQALELDKYVSTLDVHRMDKEGLLAYISGVLSDDVLVKLEHFDEPAIKKEIVSALLRCSELLTPAQFGSVAERMKKLSNDGSMLSLIQLQQQRLTRKKSWEKNMPWLLLLITAIICTLIIILS